MLREPAGEADIETCLVDFGLAYQEGRPAEEKILGTVHYMPPERILGGRMDRQGDLYSLGIMAYRYGPRPSPSMAKTRWRYSRDTSTILPPTRVSTIPSCRKNSPSWCSTCSPRSQGTPRECRSRAQATARMLRRTEDTGNPRNARSLRAWTTMEWLGGCTRGGRVTSAQRHSRSLGGELPRHSIVIDGAPPRRAAEAIVGVFA